MKKSIRIISCMGLLLTTGLLSAQGYNPDYINGLYRYGQNDNLSGTARYRGLNGAMGALGGDLSATIDNPAGASVFLNSEANITLGINKGTLDIKGENDNPSNKLGVDQAGAVMVFNNYSGDKWKNFAISLNYQKNTDIDELLRLNTDIKSRNSLVSDNSLRQVFYNEKGNSSLTNMSFSGNYDNKLYFGLGFNFHQFSVERIDALSEYSHRDDKVFDYVKDGSPDMKQANGFSLSLGIISRVSNNVRLGLAYESPKWYTDIAQSYRVYGFDIGKDNSGSYYSIVNERRDVVNDMTTAQKFTGSVAFILAKKGLINVDYTYNDYSSAKFSPENSRNISSVDAFQGENAYINSQMRGTSTVKVGGETRIKDLSLRAGFRYEQTPFKDDIFKPYGDLTSYSVGVGYNLKNFYIDAAYSFSQRDRNYLLHGLYYNNGASVDFKDLIPGVTDPNNEDLKNAGRRALRVNTFEQANNGLDEDGRGYAMSIKDITQKMSNFSLTLGLRF